MHFFGGEVRFGSESYSRVKNKLFESAKFVAFLGEVVVVESSSIPERKLKGGVNAGGEWKGEIKSILCFHPRGTLR